MTRRTKRRPPTTWDHVAKATHGNNEVRVETKNYTVLDRREEMGKTRIRIECPFCIGSSWAYVWSLCGGGKRCEYKDCRALFGSTGQAHRLECAA